MLRIGFSEMFFMKLKKFPFIRCLMRVLIRNQYWVLSNASSALIKPWQFSLLVCFFWGGGLFWFWFFFFLWPHLQHMEILRLGAESELQLLAYTTATATQDPSRIRDLHRSLQQCKILNPLSEARDRTCNLNVPNWIHFCCTTTGTPLLVCE